LRLSVDGVDNPAEDVADAFDEYGKGRRDSHRLPRELMRWMLAVWQRQVATVELLMKGGA
jgi:hypothetical protein